jgi:hypothetical protein
MTTWANVSRQRSDEETYDMSDRPCTCHPDDNPPVPCPQKYALSECRAAAPKTADDIMARLRRAELMCDAYASDSDGLSPDSWNEIRETIYALRAAVEQATAENSLLRGQVVEAMELLKEARNSVATTVKLMGDDRYGLLARIDALAGKSA